MRETPFDIFCTLYCYLLSPRTKQETGRNGTSGLGEKKSQANLHVNLIEAAMEGQ